METKVKYKVAGWQWIIAAAAFFIAVLTCQQYILFEIEQTRVFVYEGSRIANQILQTGGIADCIALFLQQFFIYKVAGAIIMAIIFTLTAFCLSKTYEFAIGRKTMLTEDICCLLPAVLLFVYTEGNIFFTTGHIAILLSSACLLLGTFLISRKNHLYCISVPLLILATGYAASTAVWPMIAALTVFAILYKRDYIAAVAILLSAVLMVGLARYTFLALTTTELFSPDYFSYRTNKPTIMIWVWIAILALEFIPFIVKKFLSEKVLSSKVLASISLAILLGFSVKVYKTNQDESTHERLALQHWVDTGDYEPACDFSGRYLDNIYMANFYFMMLSHENELENEVGGILVDGKQLIMPMSELRFVRRLLMDLYYYLGYVNGAEREAFEYNEPTEGMMAPPAIKILALTSIVKGHYELADKFLSYLDHTMFYREWSQRYRKFLYNDKAVESDPELGPRRKTLGIESVPQTWTTLPHIIRQISFLAPELPATNYKKAFRKLGEYNI